MSISSVVILAILVCTMILLIKNYNSAIGFILSISFCALLLVIFLPKLNSIFHTLNNISTKAGIGTSLFKTLIKCLGITYLTDWGVNICRDSGQNAIASKIEIIGKVLIISIILPLVEVILQNVVTIIK